MAAIRDFIYGGIAVDSIVLSPECQLSTGKFNPLNSNNMNPHLQRIIYGTTNLLHHIFFCLNSELLRSNFPQIP